MSHRVTTETEMKDAAVTKEVLRKAGMDFNESGDQLYITSGPLQHATIDLKTGRISGDTDWHSKDSLGMLRQSYGEGKYLQELSKQGGMVTSRSVDKNGNIVLMCAVG